MCNTVLQMSSGLMSSQNHYNDRSSETCVHFYKTVPEVMMMTLSYKMMNWRENC
jgi:hypothetical protein